MSDQWRPNDPEVGLPPTPPTQPEPDDEAAEVAYVEQVEAETAAINKSSTRLLIGAAVLLVVVVIAGAVIYKFVLHSTEKDYLAKLQSSDLTTQFTADRAAVQNARDVCDRLDHNAKAQGSAADKIGVEYYCPDYLPKFVVLRKASVAGSLTIDDSDWLLDQSGSRCSTSGGYSDINSSTAVIVKDTGGKELARTELGPGTVTPAKDCLFTFRFDVTEGADKYLIEISHRGQIGYSFDDLLQPDRVAITLGG